MLHTQITRQYGIAFDTQEFYDVCITPGTT
jgi:hypothetical protein